MAFILKPLLLKFVTSSVVKKLIIKALSALAESSDNTIDDKIVKYIKNNLFPEK